MTQSTLKPTDDKPGCWYGLVFGVDEDTDTPVHKCEEYVIYNHRGHLRCGSSENATVKQFFYKICNQLEKFGEIAVSFHNGYTDSLCKFHGYHWHVYLHARLHPTSDARWGKELQALARASPAGQKMYLAATAAHSHALLKHILKAPRELKYYQGMELSDLIPTCQTELEEMEKGETGVDWDPAKLKQDKNASRLKVLMALMEKYHTISGNVLRKKMLAEEDADDPGSDWQNYMTIISTANYEQLWKKAVTLMKSTYLSKKINKLFNLELNTKDEKFIPLAESLKLFNRWCEHQQIDEYKFCKELFDVLMHRVPKFNTFSIQGPPNAGKSFILRSIMPWYRWWGEIRLDAQGYAFAFENAVDVGVIMIEEPVITPIQVEQMKMLMEGAETYVKCKRIGDELVMRTPILITHNDSLSRFVSSIDRDAMDSRMYKYATKKADFLKDAQKLLNPGIWPILYKLHGLDVDELMADDSDVPSASQQQALEDAARAEEEPPAKRMRQVDGPFDDSDNEEPDVVAYRERVVHIQDAVTQMIDGCLQKVDKNTNENMAIQSWIKDNLLTAEDWHVDMTTETQIARLNEIKGYWARESTESTLSKWHFIHGIHKLGKFDGDTQTEMFDRTEQYIEKAYPIYAGLDALTNMLEYMKSEIKHKASVIIADQMADERAIQYNWKKKALEELNVPPNAPKTNRCRAVDRSEVVAKKLDFDQKAE